MYVPLYEKRTAIVNGGHEPTDEEAQWPSDLEDDLPENVKEKIAAERGKQKETSGEGCEEDEDFEEEEYDEDDDEDEGCDSDVKEDSQTKKPDCCNH
ncbi:unnamed protein product [Acanthoscelides obtectus]|uniref:Uncharacterized protein n=1 Tax=Acanthoscelides obtectus TaxID=200917 RepID=A0A9P0VQ53_ACAOB|nr:unnamed protein product [Acanthoscelides obtectus]CAK1656354.1 hypothetical protein AOBTE_LOCUS19662 [Acanthoscelides obtectus]